MLNNARWLLVSILVIAVDYASKHMALTKLFPYQPVTITSFFNFTLAFNKGAAFSFLNAESGWQHYFFIGLAFGVSATLLVWLHRLKANEKWQAVAIAFILGGAWGNVIDRLQLGHVVDFLDFHVNQYHWPIFNLADSFICIGAVMMLVLFPFGEMHNENSA